MGVSVCFVPLAEAQLPDSAELISAFAGAWPELPALRGLSVDGNTLTVPLGPMTGFVALMPDPLPDLSHCPDDHPLWPELAKDRPDQVAHLVVTVQGELPPLARATLLTQLTTAVLGCCEGLGVYWVDADMAIEAGVFSDIALDSEGDYPRALWVDFHIARSGEGSSGYTRGLEAFGLQEVEVNEGPEPPEELYDRFFGLAAYLLAHGSVIEDGDTLGESEDEKIQVRYGASSFGHPSEVMQLHYES